jgi:short-subunit dehydrogenase
VHVTVVKPGYTDTEMNPDAPKAGLQRRVLWLDAEHVARAAVDAVERGRLHCVPGATWRVADTLIESLPRSAVRLLSSRVRG